MKNGRHTLKLLTVISLLAFTLPALAGPGAEGNGSGAMLCNDKYVFFDLWEATEPGLLSIDGLKITLTNQKDVGTQITEALDRLKQSNPRLHSQVLDSKRILDAKAEYKHDVKLPKPSDLDLVYYPDSCEEPEGLARWENGRELFIIDADVYDELRSNTDAAAMWVHEYVYAALEFHYEAETSFAARLITGYLFSDKTPQEFPFAEADWYLNHGTYKAKGPYSESDSAEKKTTLLYQLILQINPFHRFTGQASLEYKLTSVATNKEHCHSPFDLADPDGANDGNVYLDKNNKLRLVTGTDKPGRFWAARSESAEDNSSPCFFQIQLTTERGRKIFRERSLPVVRSYRTFYITHSKISDVRAVEIDKAAKIWAREY